MRRVAICLVALALSACEESEKPDEVLEEEVVDLDADGSPADVDCDDTDATVHPDAREVCDGVDNNCNGRADDADPQLDASTATTFYEDSDGDGYGVATQTVQACVAPAGFSGANTDCLDTDPNVSPAGLEVCNGIDDDCDDWVDDDDDSLDSSTGMEVYVDADGDGHGDAERTVWVCEVGDGTASVADDCDDTSAERAPDLPEICGDGIDNDCSGDDKGCGLHFRGSTTDAEVTFATGTQVGLGLGESLLIHDQNGDGTDDLVVFAAGLLSGASGERDGYRYVAHGPFSPGAVDIDASAADDQVWISDDLSRASSAANVGDLDGDGRDDLVYSSDDTLFFESGGGGPRVELPMSWPQTIHPVGDLDGDGAAEVLVGHPRWSTDGLGQGSLTLVHGSSTVFADLADPDTRFEDRPQILSTGYSLDWSVQLVSAADSVIDLDYDADGLRDLVVGATGQGTAAVSALTLVRDAASLTAVSQLQYDALSDEYWTGYDDYSYFESELATGDLNNDGYDDLVATETFVGGAVYVMFGQTASVSSGAAWNLRDVLLTGSEAGGEGELGRRVTVADLDGDGVVDLLATDPVAPTSLSDGMFGFLSLDTAATMGHTDADVRIYSAAITGQCSAARPLWADLSGDGIADLTVGCVAEPLGGQAHIFFGEGG